MHHTLDLGPNKLPGIQQYTTVEPAAALSIQEKFKGKYEDNLCNENGQCRNEWYTRAENMVPQLDGTYNVSDDSDIDSQLLGLGKFQYYSTQNARAKAEI